MDNKYVYSTDGESYQYEELGDVIDSIENALEEGETALGKTYYKGVAKKPLASSFCTNAAYNTIERVSENAYDEHGEWADGFPVLKPGAYDDLQKLIENWCNANMEVTFYGVVNVEELVITEEDL
jgi:hypothetical protein